MEKHKKEKKKLGLSTKIFIALLTGAVCGVLIHYYMPEGYFRDTILINGILYVLGNGFIRLMQMLVVPLVFCSLVCGAMAIGDTKTLGTVHHCLGDLRGTGYCQSDQSRRRFK